MPFSNNLVVVDPAKSDAVWRTVTNTLSKEGFLRSEGVYGLTKAIVTLVLSRAPDNTELDPFTLHLCDYILAHFEPTSGGIS